MEAIRAYERGLRQTPRRETVALLVSALQLTDEARTEFESAARGKRTSVSPAPSEARHNLPWQPTTFVGREREMEELSGLLDRARLVTVTGAGGIGKTRAVLELAARLPKRPGETLRFVDLSLVTDGALLASRLASALRLELPAQDDLASAVVAALKDRDVLLVLDNCEHVIAAVREFAAAVLSSTHVRLLATSREPLKLAAERSYRLPPLSLPTALALFVERATNAQHGFRLTENDVEAATDICRRLDGIPLAIELAAARLPMLGLAELRSQLARHFRVIAGGHYDLPVRQRALTATIVWSYDLLEEPERILFRRLAIFASSWTLEAAETICAGAALEAPALLDTLFSLVEKSLVNVDLDTAFPRYAFFESTHAFASEQLAASGERAELARRHAQWAVALVERSYDAYAMLPEQQWEAIVLPELDGILAALEWALEPGGDVVLGARMAGSLEGVWMKAGYAGYGRRYVIAALERLDSAEHPALVGRLLLAQCAADYSIFDRERLRPMIALLERGDDRRLIAEGYRQLAYTCAQLCRYSEANEASERGFAILREAGLQRTMPYARHLLMHSSILTQQGRLEEARAVLTEALGTASALGAGSLAVFCQYTLAEIESASGNTRNAAALTASGIASARRIRSILTNADVVSLCNLAGYQLALGEVDAAEASAREAVTLGQASTAVAVPLAVQHLAAIAALRGQAMGAARLRGYVDAWLVRMSGSLTRDAIDQKSYDILLAALRKHLSEAEIATLAVEGAHLTEASATDAALRATAPYGQRATGGAAIPSSPQAITALPRNEKAGADERRDGPIPSRP
jgi:predicted ATPase